MTFVGDVADHVSHRDLVADADHDAIELVLAKTSRPRREPRRLLLEAVEHLVGVGAVVVLVLGDRVRSGAPNSGRSSFNPRFMSAP
jgi:hypothetical protein